MGSAVLIRAAALVRTANACALALGFKRMAPSLLGINTTFPDCPSPMRTLLAATVRASRDSKRGPLVPRVFGATVVDYFKKYGGRMEHLAKIVLLLAAQDGAACCIVSNEAFVRANKLENQEIELVATEIATDCPDAFAERSTMDTIGYGMTRRLADKIFAWAGASRDDVGVVELHDCFVANEARAKFTLLVTYPALGLWAVDDGRRFVERGDNTYGGKYVVNPSGGVEAKGHPIGATSLAMHFSITIQQEPGLCMLQGYATRPPRGGHITLCTTSRSAVQLSSAPSVAENFTTPMAQAYATGKI
ncbi:hypothetical protein BJY52DRAFT_1224807 [Lactarius psammicola]|nr:hypothetical protein BJY52DRAFT_1224807 [Lactarius psammicola]